MKIDVSSMDEYRLGMNDIIHIRIETKDPSLIERLTKDLQNAWPSIANKLLVTSSGIIMSKFTKDELRNVRNDINKILGESASSTTTKSVSKTTDKCKLTAYRVKNKKSGEFVKSGAGKTIWLRKPNIKQLFGIYYVNIYEIVEFDVIER